MIRHLVKLVWRRKRVHGLLIVEIFASFLVLFAVASAAVYFGGNWTRPLGFDWHDVWIIDVAPDGSREDPDSIARQAREFRMLLAEVRAMPAVVAAGGANATPYDGNTSVTTGELEDGSVLQVHLGAMGDGALEALGVPLVAGRGFGPEDAALEWTPLVIDRELAAAWFGEEDPLGRNPPWGGEDAEASRRFRVVGLVDDYRKDGELAGRTSFSFRLLDLENPEAYSFEKIVLRVAGTPPAGFEEDLLARLQRLAPAWSFDLHALEDVRAADLRGKLIPLGTLAVLAGFLLLMVALGLVGVMWQNVTQRTREIGLRRATGASAAAIRRQVLAEMLLMAGFGVALGVVVVAQLPVVGWFPALDGGLIGAGLAGATALIVALTLLCGVVPSRLATAVHPAEALHYE